MVTETNDHHAQPPECPDSVYQILASCWAKTPEDRPNFDVLMDQFSELRGRLDALAENASSVNARGDTEFDAAARALLSQQRSATMDGARTTTSTANQEQVDPRLFALSPRGSRASASSLEVGAARAGQHCDATSRDSAMLPDCYATRQPQEDMLGWKKPMDVMSVYEKMGAANVLPSVSDRPYPAMTNTTVGATAYGKHASVNSVVKRLSHASSSSTLITTSVGLGGGNTPGHVVVAAQTLNVGASGHAGEASVDHDFTQPRARRSSGGDHNAGTWPDAQHGSPGAGTAGRFNSDKHVDNVYSTAGEQMLGWQKPRDEVYIYEKVGPANVIRGDSAAAQLEEHGAEDYGVFNFAVPPDPVFRPAPCRSLRGRPSAREADAPLVACAGGAGSSRAWIGALTSCALALRSRRLRPREPRNRVRVRCCSPSAARA